MIKITAKWQDYDATKDEAIDREEVLRFNYTLKTVKFYEQRTGRNFYDDFKKATESLTGFIGGLDITDLNKFDDVPDSEKIKLMPLLTDPEINRFMVDLIPVMYAKPENGALVQSESTIEEAEEAAWLIDLINLQSFMQLFGELTRFGDLKKPAAKTKKTTAKK